MTFTAPKNTGRNSFKTLTLLSGGGRKETVSPSGKLEEKRPTAGDRDKGAKLVKKVCAQTQLLIVPRIAAPEVHHLERQEQKLYV